MRTGATILVLGDAVTAAQRFVDVFFIVYTLAILIYILLSWFRLPYSAVLSAVQGFLHDVCSPYLGLFRRIIPPLGPLDVSPVVAIVVLGVVQRLVHAGIGRLD
jgi:YggT family protein